MARKAKRVPIDPDDATKGHVDYIATEAAATQPLKGVFVTTYYFRETDCAECKDFKGQDSPWTKTDVYKTGLLQYLRVTEQPEFAGWKVVIYTDALSVEKPVFRNSTATQDRIRKHWSEWQAIANHPNVVFAVVTWPEYAVGPLGDGKTIDNAILRAMRLKAFQDFATVPVFLRDADTLFENLVKVRPIVRELAVWEDTLRREFGAIANAPGSPYKLLVASQPNYHRQWHVHPVTGTNTTGCYAAVTTSLGPIPEWQDGTLWRKCLKYLRTYSQVVDTSEGRAPNDLGKPTYIGKDEQLVSYVVLPAIFEKIYFYYLEYIQVEGTAVVTSKETPFGEVLLSKGIERYPSPYLESRGEPLPDLQSSVGKKRKDKNEVTETTLLSPKIIGLTLKPENHRVLQLVFRYFLQQVSSGLRSRGQAGGGRRKRRGRGTRRGRSSRGQSRRK